MTNLAKPSLIPAAMIVVALLSGGAVLRAAPSPARGAPASDAITVNPAIDTRVFSAPAALSLTLGPPATLRDTAGRTDQPARIIPDTLVTAGGRPVPSGVVANFVRDASTGFTHLRLGFAPLSGAAFDPDHDLAQTTRIEDLGIGRPDAVVDPSTGNALLAYILNIRGRHDILFGQLVEPLSPGMAYTPRWLNRTDIRTPQQIAFARPADIGAPRQIVGFTAFRTDASAGSIVYAASLDPADLTAEIVDVTPAGFRNCTDIRIFFSTVGPVATARCRNTESTLWRAVIARLPGIRPWSGAARMTEPTILGPDDEAEDLRVLHAAMDPTGREITLAWAASAEPSRPELEWDARRFDVAAWAPVGEAEPFDGEGVEATVSYLDLGAHGWSEMRAILDVADDAGVNRGRITLAGRRAPGGELVRASAWLEPGAVPDGIIPFGAWTPTLLDVDLDRGSDSLACGAWTPPASGDSFDDGSDPPTLLDVDLDRGSDSLAFGADGVSSLLTGVGLVVYRLDGRLHARRLDIEWTDTTTPPTPEPTATQGTPATPDPGSTPTSTAPAETPAITPTDPPTATPSASPTAIPTSGIDPSDTPTPGTVTPTPTTDVSESGTKVWLPWTRR